MDHLNFLIEEEKKHKLYKYKICNIPIWRLVRFVLRSRYLFIKEGFQHNSNRKGRFLLFGSCFVKSLIGICSIMLFPKQLKNRYVFFAFPRLQEHKNEFIDKFTDPVIVKAGLGAESIVFQGSHAGMPNVQRYKSSTLVYTDFIAFLSDLIGLIILPVLIIYKFKGLWNTYNNSKNLYMLSKNHFLFIAAKTSRFVITNFFYRIFFRRIKPKIVFVVNRELYFPVIVAAKRLNIKVAEFQHGITLGESVLYSGEYNSTIDPDYFLVFGRKSIGSQFAIPISKIYNIGWAYKEFIQRKTIERKKPNSVLLISEPHITDQMINIMVLLATEYKDYQFYFRPHPQEKVEEIHKNKIINFKNANLASTVTDSAIEVSKYDYVLGENSSVLFEALAAGIKVGRLSMNGLKPTIDKQTSRGFYFINNIVDFKSFVRIDKNTETDSNEIYSDFDKDKFNSLLNNNL